jgi:two-component system LytT family response regulator
MTFIALDDEPIALAIIERYARNVPDLQLVGTFTDAAAAAEFLHNNTVDLLLTDINMPDVSGLQFVRDLPDERPMVIFVTAYKEHAHTGFDLNVVDYLVKPVSPERFNMAIQKAAGLLDLHRKAESAEINSPCRRFFLRFFRISATENHHPGHPVCGSDGRLCERFFSAHSPSPSSPWNA